MTAEPYVLREFEQVSVSMTHAEARAIDLAANGHLTVEPGPTPDDWVVRAGAWVGTVVTPSVSLLIRPKVSAANLFHLLESDGSPVPLGTETFDYERSGDLMASFATFFARHLDAALSRGLARAYREEEEQLAGLRGRIDLGAQRRAVGLPLPLICRFDEYTADTQLNRILLAAAARLARLPGVALPTRRMLAVATARLAESGTLLADDLRYSTQFTRLNEHFRPAERLARLALEGSSLTDTAGGTNAAVFLVNMNRLFEVFVESRLRRYLAGKIRLHGQRSDSLNDSASHSDRISIEPDLTFTDVNDRVCYVADAKYKLTADGYGRQSDYYQLLAYSAALGQPEGMLVYCQHDGTTPPRDVFVRNLGTRLSTWPVQLSGSPEDLETRMFELAYEIRSRISVAGRSTVTSAA